MTTKIKSAVAIDYGAAIIDVEIDISKGLPNFFIVGMADISVKESKERVRAAILNSGFEFPLGRITVNLAPAEIKKAGSLLDLPIAIGILMESNQVSKSVLEDYVIFGELSLFGEVKEVLGTLSIALEALKEGNKNLILPYKNIREGLYIKENNYYPFSTLKEVVSFINYNDVLPYNLEEEKLQNHEKYLDFSSIIGQETAKRAMVVTASGRHNILLFGSTGVGKTMLARALPSIMPKLSNKEEIEVAKVYSILGILGDLKNLKIPFIEPHHTITKTKLIGGKSSKNIGDIVLANMGILFLDELLEFKREVLESLREPIEERYINISTKKGICKVNTNFITVGACNLCKCGKSLLDGRLYNNECNCSEGDKNKYLNRLSKAIKDRIDIYSYIPPIKYSEIDKNSKMLSSKDMVKVVNQARDIQLDRFKGTEYLYNSEVKGKNIFELCRVDNKIKSILEHYFNTSNPSMRSYGKVIKISRTIADIDNNKDIKPCHIIEALNYRKDFYGEII